jgi:hypothetical protein
MFLKSCIEIKTRFTFNIFSPKIRAINEIMWKKQKCIVAFPLQTRHNVMGKLTFPTLLYYVTE